MKTKAIHNGYCLSCGKESISPFCNRGCYRDYVKGNSSRIEKEKQRRDSLTDAMVRKAIYIQGKGSIKYIDITLEMITEKRAHIMAHREHRAEAPGKSRKVYFPACKVCGRVFTARTKRVDICSDECRKEQARRDNYTLSKVKKVLKEHLCNECGKPFTPEYGNKRRGFCSGKCGSRHANRNAKHIRRARLMVACCPPCNTPRERVYRAPIYARDRFTCQICKGKVNMKAKVPHPLAPTLDHIVALANGGHHEPSNVRLAHFMCNSFKGDRATDGGDQLLLFG